MVMGEEEKTAILYGLTWKHRVKWEKPPLPPIVITI